MDTKSLIDGEWGYLRVRQPIIEDHKPQHDLHELKKVERCISERKESLAIIDAAARDKSLLFISSFSVNCLMWEHTLAGELFQTLEGALRAAETAIEHAVFKASKKSPRKPTLPFVWSAIDLPASRTLLSPGEPGQLIRSKIMLTYSKGVSDISIDVSLLLPEYTNRQNQTDA